MNKIALIKDILRDIKKSKGRYFSIVVIIALGVAFFFGLKMAPESMWLTADKYYDDYNLMDIRLVSSLGLTKEDLKEVEKTSGVKDVFGTYSMDVLGKYDEKEIVLKIHGYSKDNNINKYKLIEGRMPERSNEAVLEKGKNDLLEMPIGSKIELLSGKKEYLSKELKNTEYTIVGLVQTPYYLSTEKGNSNIGNGKVDSFIVIPQENFKLEVYTDIFLTIDGAKDLNSYKDEYFDLINPIREELETLAKKREFIRFEDIIEEGSKEVEDGREKYLEEKEKVEKELGDAEKVIQEARQKIQGGEKEIKDAELKIADGEKEIRDGEKEIQDAIKEIRDGEKEILDGERKVQEAIKDIEMGEQELRDGEKDIKEGEEDIKDAELKISDGEKEIKNSEQEIIDGIKEIEKGEKEIQNSIKEIQNGEKELQDAIKKIQDGEKEIEKGERELRDGERELQDGEIELRSEERKFEEIIEYGKQEISMAEEKLRKGEKQYEEGLNEINNQKVALNQAEIKIKEGEVALFELKKQIELLEMALQSPELSEEEKQGISAQLEEIKAITIRTEEELSKGNSELEAGKELIAAGETILNETKKILDSSRSELEIGRQELLDGEAEGLREFGKARREIEFGRTELEYARGEIEGAKTELADGRKEIEEGKIDLANGRREIEEGKIDLANGRKEIEDAKIKLEDGRKEIKDAKIKLIDGRQEINKAKIELAEGRKEIEDAKIELEDGKKEIKDSKIELEDGKKEIEVAKIKLEDGKKEIEVAKIKLEDGRKKIDVAKIELADGVKEYEEGKEKADKELGEALEEIEDGERELRKIEKGKWYVLDREKHYSYMDYGGAADRMDALAKVFPMFFVLVAALICLTSMTRMVDEQRINIGTLKALGYGVVDIAGKYIFYALTATILGSIIGLAIGYILFPTIIFNAYGIMYTLPNISLAFNGTLAISITLGAILITTGTTFIASSNELKETPAILMRSKAPKIGKRILLERIPAIWNKFNFSYKVTIRNIFRYKRRFFMTVFGIAGCTALMLTAFGIRDSITTIVDKQYGSIFNYDISIALEEEEIKHLDNNDQIKSYELMLKESGELSLDDLEKEIFIIVPKNNKNIESFIRLQDRKTEKQINIPREGVIISEQISKDYNLDIGDEIFLKNAEKDQASIKVSGITENYTFNYAYMSQEYYENIFPEKVKYNEAIATIEDTSKEAQEKLSRILIDKEEINSVRFNSSLREDFENTLSSIIYVVILMIISAGALAFVVLYNLTNINISERNREIATIKVLGFYDGEVSAYIYRENNILSFIGIGVGLVMGRYLHRFIMLTVEMDNIMFGLKIDFKSHIMAMILTTVFSVLVNMAMHYKLKTIEMVESLKSVD